MIDAIVTIILGLAMLVPIINMIVGAAMWGWGGFAVGLVLTILSAE